MQSCYIISAIGKIRLESVTHLTLTLVHMIYSISSENGFWNVKELVLIQIHSLDLARNRNITDRTWPFNFTTWGHKSSVTHTQSHCGVFIRSSSSGFTCTQEHGLLEGISFHRSHLKLIKNSGDRLCSEREQFTLEHKCLQISQLSHCGNWFKPVEASVSVLFSLYWIFSSKQGC